MRTANHSAGVAAWLLPLALLLAAGVRGLRDLGYCLNETPSVALGVWRIRPLSEPLQGGAIVSLCLPDSPLAREAHRRNYLSKGRCRGGLEPMLKPVAAIPGDEIEAGAEGIRVNGLLLPSSNAKRADGQGRLLPQAAAGRHRVPAGTVWVIASGEDSFDSRYFGPVPVASIEGTARSILVWQGKGHQ